MAWSELNWETSGGVHVARVCGRAGSGHTEHWPRAVILDLSAEQFEQFDSNPLKFARDHNLYPEQPVLWMSDCAKPPMGKGVPKAAPGTRWIVVINHGKRSVATSASVPCDFLPCDDDDAEST